MRMSQMRKRQTSTCFRGLLFLNQIATGVFPCSPQLMWFLSQSRLVCIVLHKPSFCHTPLCLHKSLLLSVLKSLISATVSPSCHSQPPSPILSTSLFEIFSSLPTSFVLPLLYAFRGTPRGYLERAQCMLTSALFILLLLFFFPRLSLVTHLFCLLSFITE